MISRSDRVLVSVDGRDVYLIRVAPGPETVTSAGHDEIARLTVHDARALLDELTVAIARVEATPLDPAEVLREVLGG